MANGQLNLRTVKLGDNADTSKNFLIEVPAVADGTLSIKRENGTDVITIGTNGAVIILGNVQSWQSPSRGLGVEYTNGTVQNITVHVRGSSTATNAYFLATVNGTTIAGAAQATANLSNTLSFVVPSGGKYTVSVSGGTPTVSSWQELR